MAKIRRATPGYFSVGSYPESFANQHLANRYVDIWSHGLPAYCGSAAQIYRRNNPSGMAVLYSNSTKIYVDGFDASRMVSVPSLNQVTAFWAEKGWNLDGTGPDYAEAAFAHTGGVAINDSGDGVPTSSNRAADLSTPSGATGYSARISRFASEYWWDFAFGVAHGGVYDGTSSTGNPCWFKQLKTWERGINWVGNDSTYFYATTGYDYDTGTIAAELKYTVKAAVGLQYNNWLYAMRDYFAAYKERILDPFGLKIIINAGQIRNLEEFNVIFPYIDGILMESSFVAPDNMTCFTVTSTGGETFKITATNCVVNGADIALANYSVDELITKLTTDYPTMTIVKTNGAGVTYTACATNLVALSQVTLSATPVTVSYTVDNIFATWAAADWPTAFYNTRVANMVAMANAMFAANKTVAYRSNYTHNAFAITSSDGRNFTINDSQCVVDADPALALSDYSVDELITKLTTDYADVSINKTNMIPYDAEACCLSPATLVLDAVEQTVEYHTVSRHCLLTSLAIHLLAGAEEGQFFVNVNEPAFSDSDIHDWSDYLGLPESDDYAQTSGGVYYKKYGNGVALLNWSSSPETVTPADCGLVESAWHPMSTHQLLPGVVASPAADVVVPANSGDVCILEW